jgi:hypothetical protein
VKTGFVAANHTNQLVSFVLRATEWSVLEDELHNRKINAEDALFSLAECLWTYRRDASAKQHKKGRGRMGTTQNT